MYMLIETKTYATYARSTDEECSIETKTYHTLNGWSEDSVALDSILSRQSV